MKVMFVGHSHLRVLQNCYSEHHDIDFVPDFVQCGFDQYRPNVRTSFFSKNKLLNRKLQKKVSKKGFRAVVSCIYGNGHNIMGFLKHDEPFDFVIPGREDLGFDTSCTQVPFEIVKNRLCESLENFRLLMRLIKESTLSRVYHLEPPPVIPAEEFIQRHSKNLIKKVKKPVINSYICRHKIWILYSELIRECCEENEVTYIRNPSLLFDDNGAFKEQYWCESCTHGNVEYGLKILSEVGEIVSSE